MAIFSRLADLLKANINDIIDKAENPEKMVKQIILDMEEQINTATKSLGQVMATEKQIKRQLENALDSSKDWEQKAISALKSNNEELAKKALESKVSFDQSANQYQTSFNDIHNQVAELKSRLTLLCSKLDEAKSKQNMLIARSKVADAQKNIAHAMNNTNSANAFSKLEKMQKKIEDKEAEAQAFSELSQDAMFTKNEFAELEKNNAVNDELARLKNELDK